MKTKDIQRMLTGRNPDAGFRTISAAKQKELLKKTQADRASIERRQEEVQLNKPVFHVLRQAVNQMRFADIVQDDNPAISKFDAYQAAKSAASSTNKRDPELSGFVASMENLWQRDPAGVFTTGQVAQYRETYKRVRANSSVVEVIDQVFPKYGFNTLDTRKLSQMASEIENQNDFNILMKEAGLAGNRPEQIRARAFVMEQLNRKKAQEDSVEDTELIDKVLDAVREGLSDEEIGHLLEIPVDVVAEIKQMGNREASKKKAQGDRDVEMYAAIKWLREGVTIDDVIENLIGMGVEFLNAERIVSDALDNIEGKMGNRKGQVAPSPQPLPIAPPPPTPMPTPTAPVAAPTPIAPSPPTATMTPMASDEEDENGDDKKKKESWYRRSQYGVPIPQPPDKIPELPVPPNGEGRLPDIPAPPRDDFRTPPDKPPDIPQPPEVIPLRGYRILEAVKTGLGIVAYKVRYPSGNIVVVPASVIDKMAKKKKARDIMEPGANEQQPDAVPENDIPADVLLGPDSSTVDTEQLETDEINEQAEGDQVNLEPHIALLVVEAKRIASKKKMDIEKAAELAIEKVFFNAPMHIKAKYWDIICKKISQSDKGLTVTTPAQTVGAPPSGKPVPPAEIVGQPQLISTMPVLRADMPHPIDLMLPMEEWHQEVDPTTGLPVSPPSEFQGSKKRSQYLTNGTTVEQFIETYPEKFKELADALNRDDYNEITRINSGLGLSAADISDISHHIFLSKLGRGQRRGQSVLNPDTSTNDPTELEPSKKPKPQIDPNKQDGVSFAETEMELDSESGRGMSDLPPVVNEPSSKLGGGKNSNFFRSGGEDFRVGDPSLDEAGNPLAIGDQVDWAGIGGEIVDFPMHGLAAVDFPEGQLRQIGVDQPSPIRVPSDELVKVGSKKRSQYLSDDEIEQQIIQMVEEGKDAIEIGIEFGLDPNEVAEIMKAYFERSAQTSTGGELTPSEGTDVSGKKDEEDEEKEDEEIEDVFTKEESLRHFQHMGENLDDRLIKRLAHNVKNRVGSGRHTIIEALAGKKIKADKKKGQFTGAEIADYVAEETGADFGELHEFIEEVAPPELYQQLNELSDAGYDEDMVELFMENFQYWKAANRKRAYEVGDNVKWVGMGGREYEGVVDSIDEDILWVRDESGSKAMVPEEQIEVTGKKNPWMGKRAQGNYRKGDWVEYRTPDGTVKDGVVQKTPPENLDPTIGIPEYEIGFDSVLESDIIGLVKVGNRRIAQTGREYPDRQPAKGNMKFTHSKGHREGNRWVIEVGWSPEQMKGMSEGNVFAQIKTAIQVWGSREEDFDWGDPADIQIENADLEAGKAVVSFVSWQINNAVPATVVMSEDELASPGGDRQRSIPGRV